MQPMSDIAAQHSAAMRELSFAALAIYEGIKADHAWVHARYRVHGLPLPAMEHARLWRRFADWRGQIGAIQTGASSPAVTHYANALLEWLNTSQAALTQLMPRPAVSPGRMPARMLPLAQQRPRPVAPVLPVVQPVVDDVSMQLWAERQMEQTATHQMFRELRARQAAHTRRMIDSRANTAAKVQGMWNNSWRRGP